MASHIARSLCVLIVSSLIFVASSADDPPLFPNITDIIFEFYETQVTVTNLDQKITALAYEYYDNSVPRGTVNLIAAGNKYSVLYNYDTNQIINIKENECTVDDIATSDYDYNALFYGWLNKSPLIIGPSAPLWMASANREKATYVGDGFQVRDITCELWTLNVTTETDSVIYSYYFANKDWTTPYGFQKLRVPIRIEVRGQSSAGVAGGLLQPINQYTDFAYFKPAISDWSVFQPKEGIGCLSKAPTRTLPKVPKAFRCSEELYDVLDAAEHADTDIQYSQVWYDYDNQMARIDKYTRVMYSSELYDFNTGVTYSNMNDQTCVIKALRDTSFETYSSHAAVGHMKNPEEALYLDGDFYYLGQKILRGIWCDVFESVEYDTAYQDTELKKFVVTVYFTQESYRIAVNGEEESRIPVFYQLKGYDKDKKVVVHQQFNVFGFDDSIWPQMYQSFDLASCFPSVKDKTYFVLLMNVESKLATIMEGQDALVMAYLREEIIKHAKISDMRLPLLRADYKTSGVFVTGLMLDRPPALKQFWREFVGETSPKDNHLLVSVASNTREKCAMACIKVEKITCLGFYYCGEVCYLKSKDILEDVDPSERQYNLGICQTWIRAEKNSLGSQPYIIDAIKNLEEAVLNNLVNITIPVDQAAEATIPVQDIVIGEGPYTGNNNLEKPFDVVITFAKLKKEDMTTREVEYMTTLNDCYTACKDSDSIACSSFSYCADSDNKQCLISSNVVVDRKTNPDDTEDDKSCSVYSLKYLDFYTAYPGRSILTSGEESFNTITSTEECAKKCRSTTKFACRGFEYCRSEKSCVLHSKHVMDLKPGEMTKQDKKSSCTHYAAKFTADYYDLGLVIIDDDTNKRSELTLEECARTCSEELKINCKSFNYCPNSAPYMTDSSCSLSTRLLTDDKVPTKTSENNCHHYEKKEIVDDWAKVKTKGVSPSGYTSKGFTGLVIAMLALGLVLGAIGFVAYSYYKSKNYGEGMSVRFMKSDI